MIEEPTIGMVHDSLFEEENEQNDNFENENNNNDMIIDSENEDVEEDILIENQQSLERAAGLYRDDFLAGFSLKTRGAVHQAVN